MSTQTTSSDIDALTLELADAFSRFAGVYKRWLHDRVGEEGLGATGVRALCALAADGPLRMGDLGDALGVTPRYVTAVVDALERDGLARRATDPSDRRALLVELTPAGVAAAAGLTEGHLQVHARLLGVLDEHRRRELLACLGALTAELERQGYASG
jgi:DNA-binding MarR family transcriptional regulator